MAFLKSILFALSMTVVASFAAPSAHAARSTMDETYFFDEDGILVGEYTIPCYGRPIRWGITTENSQTITTSCGLDGGGGDPQTADVSVRAAHLPWATE